MKTNNKLMPYLTPSVRLILLTERDGLMDINPSVHSDATDDDDSDKVKEERCDWQVENKTVWDEEW